MTEKTRKNYIKNNGEQCPYCGSSSLKTGRMDYGSHHNRVPVTCLECKREWDDVYRLVGIEPTE